MTAYTFTGNVSGATGEGTIYVRGPNQEEIVAPISLSGGSYSVTTPLFCGTNIVKRVFTNGSCTTTIVTEVETSACVDADIRVTLTWDSLGRDWELHLVKPGGTINDNATDCTWTSCVHSSPDWGVLGDPSDNPRKDVDNVGAFGPENIWLDNPEPGTYTVLVEHWNSLGSPQSDGRVIINLFGKLVIVDVADLRPHHVWKAATITWPGGEVRTCQDVHDCTANWSSGCRDPLP